MGCVSMLEDIQERRDEAKSAGRAAYAVSYVTPEPPPATIIEEPLMPKETPAERERLHRRTERSRLGRGRYVYTRDTVVMRGGEQRWTGRIGDVFISAFDRGGPNRALQVEFKMPSKGGGETHVSGRFGPKDFHALMQGMVAADRQMALEVMTQVIAQNRD